VIGTSLIIALLVAQSRLRSKIHSFWEALAGAFLGITVTSVFFMLFR
jgi:diacylglycerol kinase (ATP)